MKNRIIKFRGFSKEENRFVYGYLFKDPITLNCYIIEEGSIKDVMNIILVENDSISQFTGLHDKNGKEIYEGDIVYSKELSFDKYKVKYYQGTFIVEPFEIGYTLEDPLEESYSLDTFCVDFETTKTKFEVIGNAYENK